MTRHTRHTLLLAGIALAAGLAFAACAERTTPDAAYLESLHTWNAPRLLHEHNALRAEEDALNTRLAEARTGELPSTAREGASRSLEESLRAVQAKRRAVDETLASGQYAQNEMRYPVQQRVLRAEPPAAPQEAAPPVEPAPASEPRTAPAPATPPAQPVATSGQAGKAVVPPASTGAEPPSPASATQAKGKAPAQAAAGKARVLGVETARSSAGLEVRIRLEGNPAKKLFTLAAPPRIVLDISGVAEPGFRLFNRTLEAVEARSLRLGWHNEAGFLRLVLDTDAAHAGRASLEQIPDGLVLRVAP